MRFNNNSNNEVPHSAVADTNDNEQNRGDDGASERDSAAELDLEWTVPSGLVDDADNMDNDIAEFDVSNISVSSLPFHGWLMQFINDADLRLGTLNLSNIHHLLDYSHASRTHIACIANRLPTRNITASEVDASKKCLICHEKYQSDEVVKTLPCIHYFHTECIDPWLSSHDTCPECRHSIVDNDISNDSGS